jgi:pilus assembly protein Flp/PilA
MKNYCEVLNCLMKDESGQNLIEYALVAAFIGFGSITALKGVSTSIHDAFTSVSSTINSAI